MLVHFSALTHLMVTIETDEQPRLLVTIAKFQNEIVGFFFGVAFALKNKKNNLLLVPDF